MAGPREDCALGESEEYPRGKEGVGKTVLILVHGVRQVIKPRECRSFNNIKHCHSNIHKIGIQQMPRSPDAWRQLASTRLLGLKMNHLSLMISFKHSFLVRVQSA